MLKFFLLIVLSIAASGCAYFDWQYYVHPYWCPEGKVLKPATFTMFGRLNEPVKCVEKKEATP